MRPLEHLAVAAMGYTDVRVTSALPFQGTNAAGEDIGPVHWFPMHDFIWVSQEMFDKLKELPRPSVPQRGA